MPRRFAATLLSPAALARFALTAAVGLGADLYTKAWAAQRLGDGQVVTAVPGWLEFEFVRNPGAVFGIAQGQRAAFLIVSVAAVVFLTYLFVHSAGKWFYQVVLGLLLAGVLGNMYDRIVYSSVRDMVHALPGWKWPAGVHRVLHLRQPDVFPYIFNVADTMLCTGVAIMMVYSVVAAPAEPKPDPVATPAEA